MNSGQWPHLTKNLAAAVPNVRNPPPAAEASIPQYSRRDEVT
jgi:hypothetical protein